MSQQETKSIQEKLEDLIIQATTERSHYYVRSVAQSALDRIKELEKGHSESIEKLALLNRKVSDDFLLKWTKEIQDSKAREQRLVEALRTGWPGEYGKTVMEFNKAVLTELGIEVKS